MENAHEYVSASSIPFEWEVRIADWLVEWGYDKSLSPRFKRVHYELVRSLFFWNLEFCEPSDYELNYRARLYLKSDRHSRTVCIVHVSICRNW
jgi:hypothetical protein